MTRLYRGRVRRGAWLLVACSLAACQGEVQSHGVAGPATDGTPHANPGSTDGGARDPVATGDEAGAQDARDVPAPATRLVRLSHTQWAYSVQDLLDLDDVSEEQKRLRADPRQSGFVFDNQADALSVDEALLRGYERVAAEIAERTVSDPQRLEALSPAGDLDARERGELLVDRLGLRAHRRPLTDAQRQAYLSLFDAGPSLYPNAPDDFTAGAQAVIEALLQSPHFLYRFEQSTEVSDDVVPLDAYEIASRLSYLLWDSMPDDALFEAAEDDRLLEPGEVASQAMRMLEDPRSEAMLVRFHEQLLEAERFENIAPAPSLFDASEQLGEHARTELALFVGETLFAEGGSFADLLTSPTTFVNAELASIYGLDEELDEERFEAVSLDPAQRAGIFTQVGFLAANATSLHPDPIHRGAFLARRIACLSIAAPPADIPPLPDPEGRTNRQRVEDHTEQPGSNCAGCHKGLINPFGFPFEGYDAVGRLRTEDLNMPIDSSASPMIDSTPTPVDDAVGLAHALAASESVHGCYARRWVEYAYGRERAPEDRALIERLATASLEDDAAVLDLLVQLVRSEAFLTRSAQELP